MTYRLDTTQLDTAERDSKEVIQEAMAQIPVYEERLNLSANNLSSWSTETVGTLLGAVPPQILTVDLQTNGFGAPTAKLDQAIGQLHGGIKNLILDNNPLGSQSCPFNLKDLLLNCPKNLLRLSLGHCQLQSANNLRLAEGLAGLNQNLEELDLANNDLFLKSTEALTLIVSNLPLGLKKLSLAYNGLDVCLDDLPAVFADIKCRLEVLDLRGNHLLDGCLWEEKLQRLCQRLPDSVKTIQLSDTLAVDPAQYRIKNPFFVNNVIPEGGSNSYAPASSTSI